MADHDKNYVSLGDFALSAIDRGQVFLHPSDTIPGLSFHPFHQGAYAKLIKIKQRPFQQPCSSICQSTDQALAFYKPLSQNLAAFIESIWPAPVTMIAPAASSAPPSLVSTAGEIGLRVPLLPKDSEWIFDCIRKSGLPFPTTSVNKHGMPSAAKWSEALTFAKEFPDEITIPPLLQAPSFSLLPSTIIQVKNFNCIRIIRQGTYTLSAEILKNFGLEIESDI